MIPNVKLDRTLVAVQVDQTVHVMLELTAPPAPAIDRAPIDVVAVIDRSGSMSGGPLRAVLSAVTSLVRLLGPHDRLGVVAFDDQAELLLPLAHHDPDAAARTIGGVRTGGSTNLSGGWLKGLEILSAHGRPEALRRVVVLTDGQANRGIIDRDALCGLTSGARSQSITTTMIGFGDGFDEQMLASLADAGGGNQYWCAGPDQTIAVFNDEFKGLASVVAQNISVELQHTDAVDGFLILDEFPMVPVDRGMHIDLGDAYGDEQRRVVAMLHLVAPQRIGPVHVADLTIRWVSTTGDVTMHAVTVPVTVGAADQADADAVQPDREVVTAVTVLKVANARKESHLAALRGDYADAAARLLAVLPLCQAAGMSEADIAQLIADVTNLSSGRWSARDSKRLHSEMRSSSKGRKFRYDEEAS